MHRASLIPGIARWGVIVALACSPALGLLPGCQHSGSVAPAPLPSPHFGVSRSLWYGFDFTHGSDWTELNRRGDNSNGEQQCYLPARTSLSSGLLTITAQVSTQTCSDTTNGTASFNYSADMLQWSTIHFVSGTLTIRAKMTGGQGPWPAIWMLGSSCQALNPSTADNTGGCGPGPGCGPTDCNWPFQANNSDEIDIAEILSSDLTHVNQEIHVDANSGACANGCNPAVSDVSQNWHTYTLVRVAGVSLTWFIDGVQTCQLTSCISSTPMGLMINVAVGGKGGLITNSDLPQTLQVSYVSLVQ